MNKLFFLSVFLLFLIFFPANISAQYIDLDYVNNMTEMYLATASALNIQSQTINKNINITRDDQNDLTPIIFEGSGNDVVILDDLSINDYPFLYIEHPSTYGSFNIYDSNDNYISYQCHDTYSVIPLFISTLKSIKNISFIEINNYYGKWKLALLPVINSFVPEYSNPITIRGDQSSVFYLKNPGKIADVWFDSNGNNKIKVLYPDGNYDLIHNTVGDYSGKIKIKDKESYFAIETEGRWSITFLKKVTDKPEIIFQDNKKIFESLNADVINLEDKNIPKEEIEIQNGVIGKWYDCGEKYKIMIYYQPIWTKSQSYSIAEGMFLLFRVKISNLSNEIIHGLDAQSFFLSRNYFGEEIRYPLDSIDSIYTSLSWEISTLDEDIKPSSELDTYLVFDVDGNYNDNWILTFSPIVNKTNNKECEIKITLPRISYTP